MTLIGIDIGGSFIKSGLVSHQGDVLHQLNPQPTLHGAQLTDKVHRLIYELISVVNEEGLPSVQAVGISSCGVVDPETGIVVESVAIPGYDGTQWPLLLEELKLPVIVENDGRCAAWAEFQVRDDQDIQDWVHVPVGTNVGCGVIIGGELFRGHSFTAGEFGHMTIDFNGPVCTCGNIGCLEIYLTKRSPLTYVQQAIADGRDTLIAELCGGELEHIDLFMISHAEAQGDAVAKQAFEQLGFYLGVGLTNLINLLNPQVITIGGGAIEASMTIIRAAREYVTSHAISSAVKDVQIRRGQLGNQAGFIGAARLAYAKCCQSP